jgi:hypothetical protein
MKNDLPKGVPQRRLFVSSPPRRKEAVETLFASFVQTKEGVLLLCHDKVDKLVLLQKNIEPKRQAA